MVSDGPPWPPPIRRATGMHVLGGLLDKAEKSKGGYAPSAAATLSGASEYQQLYQGADLPERSAPAAPQAVSRHKEKTATEAGADLGW